LKPYTVLLVTALSGALWTVTAPDSLAAGDGSGEAGTASASAPQLDMIVVTANKRAQSADNVGMAITALTGEQLNALGVNDVAGLAKVDPSVAIAQGNWGGVTYQIRGVGYNDFSLAASPTVSVYTDQVPYAYPDMSKGATFDVQRVEILKGPQGTLFGQNSTGGAVNYIAAKPTDRLHAGFDGTYARFNATDFSGFVSGPLNSTIRARLAFKVNEGGAWQKSHTRKDSLGDKDAKFGRLIVDWTPTDGFDLSVNINGWVDRSQTQAGQLQGVYLGNPKYAADVLTEVTAPVAPQNARAADWLAGTHPAEDEHYYQGSAHAEYRVSDRLSFTYLGTFEHYRQNDLQEPEGMDNVLYLLQGGTVRSTAHELRAAGTLLAGRLHWLVGGSYADNRTLEQQLEDVGGTTSGYSLTRLTGGVPFASFINASVDDSVSKAGFGNLEFHPSPRFRLHAGLRFTQTDISHGGCMRDDGDGVMAFSINAYEAHLLHGVGVIPAVPGGCTTFDSIDANNLYHPTYTVQSLNQNNVSWRAGVDFTPDADTLIYGTVSRGYKAGSFPTLAAIFNSALLPVTQESVLAYEAGLKRHMLDGRLAVDADVFYYDYADKQLEMRRLEGVFGLLNTLINIPKSREIGAELALEALPFSGLRLTVHGTYLDAVVTSQTAGYNPFSTTPIDLQGEPFPNTPKWAVDGDAEYTWSVGASHAAFVGLDARYRSANQGEFGSYQAIAAGYVNTPSPLNVTNPPVQPGSLLTVNDAYTVMDVRAGFMTDDGHWKFQAFVNNVTDRYYWNQSRLVGDAVVRFAGLPRIYGVSVRYRY
jgi:iron complex outermembrane receptor protein